MLKTLLSGSIRGLLLGAAALTLLAAPASATDPVLYVGAKGQGTLVPATADPDAKVDPFGPDFNQVNTDRNIWGEQSVKPPRGLVLVEQGPKIDQTIYDVTNTSFGKVRSLLVEPSSGHVHYLVVTSHFLEPKRFLPIPITAIRFEGDNKVRTATALKLMKLLDVYTIEKLGADFPMQPLAAQPSVAELVFKKAAS